MTHTLVISVRFHEGRYHGAGDWPPSPARLFQALVAATANPVADHANDALEWLEKLDDAPTLAAPASRTGQHIALFVPNNDLDAKGGDIRRIAEIRSATKHIRPRLFDASVPLLYVWRFDGDDAPARKICEIAEGLYQLGRGVDMAWAVGEVLDEAAADERLEQYPGVVYRPSSGGDGVKLDCPQEGSLDSLIDRHNAGAKRFERVGNQTRFTNAPRTRFRLMAYNSPSSKLLFDLRRTTETHAPFAPWPLKGAAELVKIVRDHAAQRLCTALPERKSEIERVFIGRDAKEADKTLRLRIIPLPSIGFHYADRGIRRVLVDVPPDCPIQTRDVAWAFSGLEVEAPGIDEATGEILSSPVQLVTADDNSMLGHYGMGENGVSSRLWRSVTPLALPNATRRRIDPTRQHEQAKNGDERQSENRKAMHEVAQALRHAGLRHRIANMRVQREPFEAKGGRAETFAEGTRFSKHQLWHVEIEFAGPVSGPIVLGSGRYCGLGLMVPSRRVEGVLAFSIVDGLADGAEPLELASALRRAVMARVQAQLGRMEKLDLFFTGHEDAGEPARRGHHAHLAFVPDLERRRLLVIAPHIIEHREPSTDERDHLGTLGKALADFVELRAGSSGRLRLMRQEIDFDHDPLFATSARWIAQTPYTATRHARKNGSNTLHHDVITETQRRGLPMPAAVNRLRNGAGLELGFKVAVPGPVLLGRTLHLGGGLFTCEAGASHRA
ncbi:MAG: type I-U CRISPR-associated protein Cas5/Cas6 [Proteobacteria bacterium]|nr:type I-U CRISPR-associated protein Cas5/Cas6 [Pseudomonadota bacterium]